MDIRIGILHSPREVVVELADGTSADDVKATIDAAVAARPGLFFGGNLGPLQAQVQRARGIHRSGFCFDQIEHFNSQISGGKISIGQTKVLHRIHDGNAE